MGEFVIVSHPEEEAVPGRRTLLLSLNTEVGANLIHTIEQGIADIHVIGEASLQNVKAEEIQSAKKSNFHGFEHAVIVVWDNQREEKSVLLGLTLAEHFSTIDVVRVMNLNNNHTIQEPSYKIISTTSWSRDSS